ncbi:hypothetical protein [Staphylococcus kloosii]|uniref:hypothetical protein n=1 Tax=Staphylococcus kloosii TaxID=29384 RepID=UPI0018EA6D30|nr:hypothetical protein [Staphylococcus kloosii]
MDCLSDELVVDFSLDEAVDFSSLVASLFCEVVLLVEVFSVVDVSLDLFCSEVLLLDVDVSFLLLFEFILLLSEVVVLASDLLIAVEF